MKNKQEKHQNPEEAGNTAESSSAAGQNKQPEKEQTSGGAMPPIQGANQSREAEQSDLR